MSTHNRLTNGLLIVIAMLLGYQALQPYLMPDVRVSAESGRFDYVHVVSANFIYKGNTGVLTLDKRNGNIWFIAKNNEMSKFYFSDPVFVIRLPLEKLTDTPQPETPGR